MTRYPNLFLAFATAILWIGMYEIFNESIVELTKSKQERNMYRIALIIIGVILLVYFDRDQN